jgi:hypothetical protein
MDKGVILKLTKKEVDTYRRPMNYIIMVEANKNGPFATIPLRICMNRQYESAAPIWGET